MTAQITTPEAIESQPKSTPPRTAMLSLAEIDYLIEVGTAATITLGGVQFVSTDGLRAYCARHPEFELPLHGVPRAAATCHSG